MAWRWNNRNLGETDLVWRMGRSGKEKVSGFCIHSSRLTLPMNCSPSFDHSASILACITFANSCLAFNLGPWFIKSSFSAFNNLPLSNTSIFLFTTVSLFAAKSAISAFMALICSSSTLFRSCKHAN